MPATQPLVIVLLGPTASGKTALSVEIAEKMQMVIHNIDSRQLYIGMDIGTAKPTLEQRKRVQHCLLDLSQPDKPITVQEFQKTALSSIERTLKEKGVAFLVGGSGLYLKSLTMGLKPPAVPPQKDLRHQLKDLGQEFCYKLLRSSDSLAAQKISSSDAVRTSRALEVLYSTGKTISSLQTTNPPNWNIIELGLDPQNLRQRIANRTSALYANGLIEETKQLANKFGPDISLLQTIGYGEALRVIKRDLSVQEAIQITTIRTQQFAKKQRTWFRRQHAPHWLNDEEPLREALMLIQAGIG